METKEERKRRLKKEWDANNRDKMRAAQLRHRLANKEKIYARKKELRRLKAEQEGRIFTPKVKGVRTVGKSVASIKKNDQNYEGSAYWRYKRYGLTPEQFDNILQSQNGMCAICETELVTPYVDHCHDTKIVRGLLCNACNVGLGRFKDRLQLVESAANYLRKSCNQLQN